MATKTKSDTPVAVEALPHKEFFIDMLTKDIGLDACILDLVDNAVDGATRTLGAKADVALKSPKKGKANLSPLGESNAYAAHEIAIEFSADRFRILDNCGGMSIKTARRHAFHFGKAQGADVVKKGIGHYGIGMKRAIFKIGRRIEIRSRTKTEGFVLPIDVPEWKAAPDWTLSLTPETSAIDSIGTSIEITQLHAGVSQMLEDKVFEHMLHAEMARVYGVFLERGLKITVNGTVVKPKSFVFLQGEGFSPHYETWTEEGIRAHLWAGPAAPLPTDDSEENTTSAQWGWYVICNNRVILAADRTERTIWGDNFPGWHPQYNGFTGVVAFESDDPGRLPWTTTKTDLDQEDPVYRRAVDRMKAATKTYIKYSRERKGDLPKAQKLEKKATTVALSKVAKAQPMAFPAIKPSAETVVNILYQKPKRQIAQLAAALGEPNMSAARVGSETFDYVFRSEVEP